MIEAGLLGEPPVFFLSIPGDCDQGDIFYGLFAPEMCGNLIAVHPRQPDVEEHDFGFRLLCLVETGGAIMGDLHVVTVDRKQPRQPARQVDVVIDDEDSGGAAAAGFELRELRMAVCSGQCGCRLVERFALVQAPWFATMRFSRRWLDSRPLAVFETAGMLSLSFTVTSCRCDWIFSGHFHSRSRKIVTAVPEGEWRAPGSGAPSLGPPRGFSRLLAKRVKDRIVFEIGTTFGGAFSVGNPEFRPRAD